MALAEQGLEGVVISRVDIAYLERRYAALEKEIESALYRGPADDLAIADLRYRKLIIADEIQHNRRLVEGSPGLFDR
jgi:hypothetical protein